MDEVNTEFIERYQKMYEKDPTSRVFAPLAEAYRKMGLIREAREVAEKGVKDNPNFPGGRVALGRIYLEDSQFKEAEIQFRKAVELAPENMLAYQLLAETYLRLKKTKEALKAYKMLLFINPENTRAQNAVRKLEALTADEYDEEIFAMKPLQEAVKEWDELHLDFSTVGSTGSSHKGSTGAAARTEKNRIYLERTLSLADAHIVRNDIERALNALNEAERLFGANPEIVKRLKLLHERQLSGIATPQTKSEILMSEHPIRQSKFDKQIDFLQDLLQKIKNRQQV